MCGAVRSGPARARAHARARARVCVCVRVCERAALARRPRCQRPLAWRWYKRRLSDGPLCPEEAPHPALGQASVRSPYGGALARALASCQ